MADKHTVLPTVSGSVHASQLRVYFGLLSYSSDVELNSVSDKRTRSSSDCTYQQRPIRDSRSLPETMRSAVDQ